MSSKKWLLIRKEFFLNSPRGSAAVFAASLSFRLAAAATSSSVFQIDVDLEPFGVENRAANHAQMIKFYVYKLTGLKTRINHLRPHLSQRIKIDLQ